MLRTIAAEPLYPWAGRPSAYDAIMLWTGQDGKLKSQALPDDGEYSETPERRDVLCQQRLEGYGQAPRLEDERAAKE